MGKKRYDSENSIAGKISAKYNLLILLIYPVVALLRALNLMDFDWFVFLGAGVIALLSALFSVAAIGNSAKIMCIFSAITSTALLLILHRDGMLILFLPILVAMLFDDVIAIRLSFLYSIFAFSISEGLNYFIFKAANYQGVLVTGLILFIELALLLSLGANLVDRVKRRFDQEKALIDNINELINNAKSLANEMGINKEENDIESADDENETKNNIIEKVRKETGKIFSYNRVIGEISGNEERKKTIIEDISLLLSLSEKVTCTIDELNADIDKLSSSIEGIGDIIEDTKEMTATASVQEIAMKEKNPEFSKMASNISNMAFGAKTAAERLVLDFREIQKDGMKAVDTVLLTYESVYRNLELINRNIDVLLRWVALKEDTKNGREIDNEN